MAEGKQRDERKVKPPSEKGRQLVARACVRERGVLAAVVMSTAERIMKGKAR